MKKALVVAFVSVSSAAFALQGGPSQPDYTQFEASGMQDMVSMQSGDFSYQVPLADIPSPYGNYPLSLSYHAGISPQQEASWVGLGWSLNPGVISRDIRGVPDDQLHGGTLGFIYQYSATQTWSVDLGYSNGAFSLGQTFSSDGSVGFSATVGVKLGGVVGVGFSVGTDAIGLNASVGSGPASLNASLMLSTATGKANASVGAKLQAGGASLGAQVSTGSGASANVGFGNSKAGVGLSVSSQGVSASAHAGSVSMSKSKNGTSVSVGGGTLSVSNASSNGTNKTSTAGFAVVIPTNIGVFSFGFSQNTYEYWMRSATSEYLYGYMYQAGPAIDVAKKNDVESLPDAVAGTKESSSGDIPWKWTMKGRALESVGEKDMVPAYDMYSVSSEGASGSFRPFAREKHQLYKLVSNEKTDEKKSLETYSELLNTCDNGWQCENEFVIKNGEKVISNSYEDYQYCLADAACSMYAQYETNFRNNGNRLVFNSNEDQFEERGGMQFLFVGEGAGYYESENVGDSKNRSRNQVSDKLLKRTLSNFDYALYGSKKVEPLFDNSKVESGKSNVTGKLAGFVVTTSDGSKYYFKKPVRSYFKVDYVINREKGLPIFVDQSTNKDEGFWENLLEGIVSVLEWGIKQLNPINAIKTVADVLFKEGKLEETCVVKDDEEKDDKKKDYFFSYTVNMNPHATQWLLTEVRGADYVNLNANGSTETVNDNIIGYYVKLNYTKDPSLYYWRTPYARPGLEANNVPNFRISRSAFTPEGCDSRKYQASFGVKEYVYLQSIETATNRVEFELNDENHERVDGKGWEYGGNDFPVLVQASVGYVVDKNEMGGDRYVLLQKINYKKLTPKYLYFNTELPESVEKNLYVKSEIHVYGLNNKTINNETITKIIDDEDMLNLYIELPNSKYRTFNVVDGSYQKTKGNESAYGLYRIEIVDKDHVNDVIYDLGSLSEIADGTILTVGENGTQIGNPYIDWSEFIFSNDETDPFKNQMRYLSKISYFNKGQEEPYREYTFGYDYSLQPKTVNSYCKGFYPENNNQIVQSPDVADVDVCSKKDKKHALYGKLTLKSIQERGCQNGKCASLPPFKFSYNAPSATSTRISTTDGWLDYFQANGDNETQGVAADDYYVKDENGNFKVDANGKKILINDFGDVDATILASTNTTDEYGFWSNTANAENHKVDQSFADYGVAAWSLNKVVDPAGGNLEVEYERDTYANGVDFTDEKKTAELYSFENCSGKLCLNVKPLYWREQCLGPRAAFWDKDRPEGYEGNGFEYLKEFGIEKDAQLFFNLASQAHTKVKCGLFGVAKCSRTRSVALVGEGKILDVKTIDAETRQVVIDRNWNEIISGLEKAAAKINSGKKWDDLDNKKYHNGYFWIGKKYETGFKAGDLRVSRLTRHDLGLKSQTIYEYGDGEMAQTPDSAYTSVLGSRFYSNKISNSLPDIRLNPMSRIVGFNDDDLLFVPGARITYPNVKVKNSTEGSSLNNGATEFFYVTPETGIPEEYIDPVTRDSLMPFVKINLLNVMHEYIEDKHRAGRIIEVSLLEENGSEIPLAVENTNNQNIRVPNGSSRRLLVFPDERYTLYFYSKDVKKASKIRVKLIKMTNENTTSNSDEIEKQMDVAFKSPMTDFNELSVTLYSINPVNAVSLPVSSDKLEQYYRLNHIWERHQKKGFYPILYKHVVYNRESVSKLPMGKNMYPMFESNADEFTRTFDADFEASITYRDLSAFLGQNYKTVFYRGNESKIIAKVDSSIYTTVVPDLMEGVVSNKTDKSVREKVGRQVERWSSETTMKCVDKDGKVDNKGKDDVCVKNYISLYTRKNITNHKDFTYIRYPAFQIGSITYTGHDNQDKVVEPTSSSSSTLTENTQPMSSSAMKFGVTELRNYRYDPIMGTPTATMAVSKLGNKEVRKITQNTPAYAVSKDGLAKEMFLRNMFTQNYLEEVFTDTVDVNSSSSRSANELRRTTMKIGKLRTFSISPYMELPIELYGSSSSARRTPIVAMGTFKNKGNALTLRNGAEKYLEYSDKNRPNLNKYSGTYIKNINQQMKVLETEDVLGRTQSTIFSDDAMFQLSLFYPAKINQVGVVLPYKNKAFASEKCSVSGDNSISKNMLIANANVTISCTGLAADGNIAVEYRTWNKSTGWQTKRDIVSGAEASLELASGDKLNYFRVYPENAEAKSFIYDSYGNMVQTIAEDNTSTYYEYDPFGKLVQSRNDDGVSFKSHHREYMNNAEE